MSIKFWLFSLFIDPTFRKARKAALEIIKGQKNQLVLDMCAGIGTFPKSVIQTDNQAIGLDINFKKERFGTIMFQNRNLMCADASLSPFRNDSFDIITFIYALHDKNPALAKKMLSEAERIIRPGGKLIIIDYAPPWNFFSFCGHLLRIITEILAGHHKNGFSFIRNGGIASLITGDRFSKTSISKHSHLFSAELAVISIPQ